MSEYRVVIPAREHQVVTFIQDEMPGIAALNGGLIGFEPKIVFQWHLSVMIDFDDLDDHRMPVESETALVGPWEEELEDVWLGPHSHKPNVIFLAQITWDGTREIIYRVFRPEPVDAHLRMVIATHAYPRPFDYRIDPDPTWKLASWHLEAARRARGEGRTVH